MSDIITKEIELISVSKNHFTPKDKAEVKLIKIQFGEVGSYGILTYNVQDVEKNSYLLNLKEKTHYLLNLKLNVYNGKYSLQFVDIVPVV